MFDKLKNALRKPLKFAFNLKNIFFVFVLITFSSLLNALAEINVFLALIVFFIRIIFSMFMLFFIIKLYLNSINAEKGRITTLHLKTDFKEIFVTLLCYHLMVFFFALFSLIVGGIIILLSLIIAPFISVVLILLIFCAYIALFLILFYANTSIIIGKNKLINAVKESANLMKNNFIYSVSRMFLLGIINMVMFLPAIVLPLLAVFYPVFLLIPDNFIYMGDAVQQEFMNQLFIDFALQNIVLVLCLFLWISLIATLVSLFNKGFVSNMYLQLTEKKDKNIKKTEPEKKTATKRKKEYDNKQ